jgi:hypothetical protein
LLGSTKRQNVAHLGLVAALCPQKRFALFGKPDELDSVFRRLLRQQAMINEAFTEGRFGTQTAALLSELNLTLLGRLSLEAQDCNHSFFSSDSGFCCIGRRSVRPKVQPIKPDFQTERHVGRGATTRNTKGRILNSRCDLPGRFPATKPAAFPRLRFLAIGLPDEEIIA